MTLLAEQTLAHQTDAEIPISTRKLKKLELATLDASDLEEPNPDEILRQAHLYDSSDKRCCINRKRT